VSLTGLGGVAVPLPCPRVNDQKLQLDVFRPASAKGPLPAVLILHGGGWIAGNRKANESVAIKLARHGYVAALVSYRFALRDPFPAQVHDVKCAVRWLRANAAKHQIDRERIGVIGYSAGGHLACMLGMTCPKKDGLEGNGGHHDQSSQVQCVVGYYPLTDLTRLHGFCLIGHVKGFYRAGLQLSLEKFCGGTPKDLPALYARASPITYACKDAAPTLLIHGTGDPLIPYEQSERLYQKLKAARAPVTLLKLEDAAHGNWPPHLEEIADAATLAFLDRHLKKLGGKR
jgi:acetyl esterase/lipase